MRMAPPFPRIRGKASEDESPSPDIAKADSVHCRPVESLQRPLRTDAPQNSPATGKRPGWPKVLPKPARPTAYPPCGECVALSHTSPVAKTRIVANLPVRSTAPQ